jgi:Phosphotransferase enzyme family
VNVDGGSGVRPWSSAAWRERAVGWLDEQLVESAIERTGAVEQPRVRPWATVLTAPTTAGRVWLKATAPRTAFEVGLYSVLHRVVPDRVLAPLAADPERGWILLPDGGPALGERTGGADLIEAMVTVLPQYARMQRELAGHTDELLGIGVDDMRPARMPERFEQALAVAGTYVAQRGRAADRDALDQLAALRATVADWCARLAAAPGPASVDHSDLHPWNVLFDPAGGLAPARFYDWGDAVLAHPFASMLVGLGAMQDRVLDTTADDPRIRRMRDVYLAEFADLAGPAELVETLQLARRVARIARALTWDRAVHAGGDDSGAELDESWLRAPLESLTGLLDTR